MNQAQLQSATTNAAAAGADQLAKPVKEIAPDNTVTGKILAFNEAGRFVVVDFPLGRVPEADKSMTVYRAGKRIGEIKITGPARDNITVADLLSGEATRGDEVR